MTSRERFEAWIKREYEFLCLDRLDHPGERNHPGDYVFPNVQVSWEAWQEGYAYGWEKGGGR